MDLKGAEIRNILEMCMAIGTKNRVPLKVNIPYYQRPYRWDETRIKNLVRDFYKNKSENASEEYFVGSVVLVENSKRDNEYDIIDGQQRVTTVFLFNYLRFLIQRSYVEELISTKSSNLDGPLKELEEIYGDLMGTKHLLSFSKMRKEIIEMMEDDFYEKTPDERERIYADIAEKYRKTVLLPVRDFSDMEKYYDEYKRLLKHFIKLDSLGLTYSRHTFNDTLAEALSTACVIVSKDNNPVFTLIGITDKTNANIRQYADALQYEFDIVMELQDLSNAPIKNTRNILQFMKEMIENVRFCVIMTGNERDAYTLFEVLNDRAMEIDDLELIKNLFLKAYCNTSGDPDILIDDNIGKLDQIWGDEVFTRDLSVAHSKLISYLGTLYLTADEKVFTNKLERYRELIENGYLKNYSLPDKRYSFIKASNDIRVYQMLRIIIEEYKLPVRNSAVSAIAAENDAKVSITYKTFHLLNALKLDGVMPALTNTIIRQYMNKMQAEHTENIDVDSFKKYINRIKEDCQHNENEGEFSLIHQLALKLWQASLLAKDFEIPREIAKKGLQCVSMKNWNPTGISIDHEMHDRMIREFRRWAQDWRYNKSSSSDLKIKILFINLFKTKLNSDGTKLSLNKAVYSFVTDKIQLDHMEANKPNESNMEKHFLPSDPHEEREMYVNALGNFMILDNDNNNDKNNKPLAEALSYYENMCSDHWLNAFTKNLLRDYHTNVNIAGSSYMVPTEKFFNERKARLIKYFECLVNKPLYENSVTIE